jgi:predicted nuclease of predicted toxin-antitoxin system
MRLLLDESVPLKLRNYLPGHSVAVVKELGWTGTKNGSLLALAARQFDVVITVDKGMQHQQNLHALPVAVVILVAKSNALKALVPLIPKLEAELRILKPRSLSVIRI